MKKLIFILCIVLSFQSCSNDDDSQDPQDNSCANGGVVCSDALASGETAGTTAASMIGTYSLTYHEFTTGGPFPDAAVVMFELTSDNKLVVTYNDQCVTIENPKQTSPSEVSFKDSCVFNIRFAASESAAAGGGLNEINTIFLDENGYYGQFY
jgi:hypothetical protein